MKIWQTWKSHDPETFHPYYKACHPTWKPLHPDWDYQLLDDNEILDFCKHFFPYIYNDFKALPKQIYRVDLVRYMLLFIKGGLYVDMDFMALKNHTPLWEEAKKKNTPIVLGKLNRSFKHQFPNAWMMSIYPYEVFWLYVIELGLILCKENKEQIEACSGPMLLTFAINRYQELRGDIAKICSNSIRNFLKYPLRNSKIWILEPDIIYPCDWDKHTDLVDKRAWIEKYSHEEIIERCPDSYAITFWSHNW